MDANTANTISAIGTALSAIAAFGSIVVAYIVFRNQKLLSQRQLIIPLWEHISSLSKIDPQAPIIPDVIKVVNTLELVALCCEGGMVDRQVIKRTFKDQFMEHYESIRKCGALKGLGCDGEALLKQNRAAVQFYNSLNSEMLAQDRVGHL